MTVFFSFTNFQCAPEILLLLPFICHHSIHTRTMVKSALPLAHRWAQLLYSKSIVIWLPHPQPKRVLFFASTSPFYFHFLDSSTFLYSCKFFFIRSVFSGLQKFFLTSSDFQSSILYYFQLNTFCKTFLVRSNHE